MAAPLKIYTFLAQNHSASGYYRQTVPLQTAAEMGLPIQVMVDTNIEGTISQEDRIKAFCEADISLLYQPLGDGPLHNLRMAKSFFPSKIDGSWKYPPSMVIDTDDNLFRVDPYNPAFQGLGYRDPESGREIPKGHQIAEVHDGVRKVLWHDGQGGFDVTRNKGNLDTYRHMLNAADAVTCTTPRSAAYVTEEASPRRVHVAPNTVRFDHYPQISLVPRPTKVHVLWQGGQNHWPDWWPLKQQIKNLTERYQAIHWILWGVNYQWVTEVIPPERLTFLPWCPYHEYKLRRVMIGEDISLAPLTNSPFNRCRSAIKWYEASVQKNPSVTLAQNTGPYGDEIQHGETGMLFNTPEEFEEYMGVLIESREERKRMAGNAKDWISDNRDAKKEAPKLIQFYEQIRAEAEKEQPHMTDRQWEEYEANVRAQQEAAEKAAKEAAAQQAA